MKIYHNPQCSKSNAAIDLLTQKGIKAEIIHYLHQTPNREELTHIIKLLHIKPLELIRTKEAIFQEKFEGNSYTDQEWTDIMLQHPELIERPIVVNGDKAIIARPAERILEIL
jgi:arsenate reductase